MVYFIIVQVIGSFPPPTPNVSIIRSHSGFELLPLALSLGLFLGPSTED